MYIITLFSVKNTYLAEYFLSFLPGSPRRIPVGKFYVTDITIRYDVPSFVGAET